jgi:cold shock CspA family protein
MADLTGMMQAAAGQAGDENLYIEDTFSTYLYTGNSSTQTITNGIDLENEGGLVWIKSRSQATWHRLVNTIAGPTKDLSTNSSAAQDTNNILSSFNADGFTLNTGNDTNINNYTYASWTFRKAPKFFDCVTWTGNGVAGRTVAHNLGSVPGCMIVKQLTGGNWSVYHRGLGATKDIWLNSTNASVTATNRWNDTAPTDSVFTLGTNNNQSAEPYVAYLFAHDAGGFGDDGDENVISCGSYTGNGGTQSITVGFEPQWLLIKRTNGADNWAIMDSMRNFIVSSSSDSSYLAPNLSNAEANVGRVHPNATGFGFISEANGVLNGSGDTYIYIAIRRGPMKTPESGTEVYNGITRTGTGATANVTTGSFPIDVVITRNPDATATGNITVFDRLRGATKFLRTTIFSDETTNNTTLTSFARMDGYTCGTDSEGSINIAVGGITPQYVNWSFRRAPGFFDVVCDTGTGSAHTISHNLGVVPELMIRKKRSADDNWIVYAGDPTDYLILNGTAATADLDTMWNDTAPTASVFTVGTNDDVNQSTGTFVTYLFASLAGVSKIGTYTGNGTSVSVTTGFQPRFILVKRTDSTGNWIVGDSARGLVAGDDPALFLNSNGADTTGQDWVDVSATGFTVNETALNANVNTGTYIYLAIS